MDTPNEFADAFAIAVPFALREMAGVEAVPRGTESARGPEYYASVSAIIGLSTPDGDWRLVVGFPEATAAALARRILAGVAVELSAEMIRDCMGEVANVVAGQAKTLLVGSPFHFTLSTPTVLTGNLSAPPGSREIVFDSDAGEFAACLSPAQQEGDR